jgi:transcriptional regulator with XRE-family HTH domain
MKKAKVVECLIKEAGYSRRQFAEMIGLPPTTLNSMLTRGLGKASTDNVLKVCKGLGITIEELEEMTSNENYSNETKNTDIVRENDLAVDFSFGQKLKELRISKKLTQEDLAKALNLKYGTNFNKGMISKWENDKEEPRISSVRYLAHFFNVSLDELLGFKKVSC